MAPVSSNVIRKRLAGLAASLASFAILYRFVPGGDLGLILGAGASFTILLLTLDK